MVKRDAEKKIADYVAEYKEDYYRLAYSYVMNVDDALDIIQESIYKAMVSTDSLIDNEHIKEWFYRIVIESSLEILRIQKRDIIVDTKTLKINQADLNTNYKDEEQKSKLDKIHIPRELGIVVENTLRGSSLEGTNGTNNFKRVFKQLYERLNIW